MSNLRLAKFALFLAILGLSGCLGGMGLQVHQLGVLSGSASSSLATVVEGEGVTLAYLGDEEVDHGDYARFYKHEFKLAPGSYEFGVSTYESYSAAGVTSTTTTIHPLRVKLKPGKRYLLTRGKDSVRYWDVWLEEIADSRPAQ